MKNITYNYIWDEIILKTIKNIEDSFDEETKRKYNFSVRNTFLLKNKVYSDYDSIKNRLKANYYDATKNGDACQSRIDNHKIAACICYSLIENKIFKFDIDGDMPTEMFVSNYRVAYMASLSFIYTVLISRYIRNGREDYADKLLKQKKLILPETSIGHDEYNLGRIHTLALNDLYGNTFDVLTYSDMMFWIEYYNRQLLENALIPMPLDVETIDI